MAETQDDPSNDPVPGAFVVLDPRAMVSIDAAPDATRARLADPDEPARRWLFRALGVRGEWVEVENLLASEADGECHPDVPAHLESLRLHLFVRRADLLPVVLRSTHTAFEDGTSLRLAAGTALGPYPPGSTPSVRTELVRAELSLAVALPADAVGLSYAAVATREPWPDENGSEATLAAGSRLRYGGDLALAGRASEAIFVTRLRASGDDVLIAAGDDCVALHAWVPAAQVGDATVTTSSGGGGFGEGCSHSPSASAGTTVYWPDGRRAGTVREDILLCNDRPRAGELECFDWRIGAHAPDASLPICFRPGELD